MTKQWTDFDQLTYQRPDLKGLLKEADFLARRLYLSNPAKHQSRLRAFFAAIKSWHTARNYCYLMYYRQTYQDGISPAVESLVSDIDWSEEKDYYDSYNSDLTQSFAQVLTAFLQGDYPIDQDNIFDLVLVKTAQLYRESLGLVDVSSLQREAQAKQKLVSLYAENQVDFTLEDFPDQVEHYSYRLLAYRQYLAHSSGRVRRQAYSGLVSRMTDLQAEINQTFEDLVDARKQLAEDAGTNFFAYINRSKYGMDLDQKLLANFKEQAGQAFQPVLKEIVHLQKLRWKQEDFLFPDRRVLLVDKMLNWELDFAARKEAFFAALSLILGPEGETFRELFDHGYVNWQIGSDQLFSDYRLLSDFKTYTLYLPVAVEPFGLAQLFASIGTSLLDLTGLLNFPELGLVSQDQLVRDLSACAFSFIGLKESQRLLGDYADLYTDLAVSDMLLNLPGQLACYDLENILYNQPLMTIKIDDLWKQLATSYSPYEAFGADGYMSYGKGWQLNFDLLFAPCSSIYKLMALVIVLAEKPHRDNRNRLERKLNKLLTSSPGLSCLERIDQAGFASPFKAETIQRAVFTACDMLGL